MNQSKIYISKKSHHSNIVWEEYPGDETKYNS